MGNDSSTVSSFVDIEFWLKIWRAIQRIIGLALLTILHMGLAKLLEFAVFVQNPAVQNFASIIAMVAFLAVYEAVFLDMIEVFWPQLLRHNIKIGRLTSRWPLMEVPIMNRIKYFGRTYLLACIVATAGMLVFLQAHHHRADEIAVVIATPLIIFQLIPYLLLKLPHEHPEVPQKDPLEDLSRKVRKVVHLAIAAVVICSLTAVIGICILASLPIYEALHLNWAIVPGAKIGALLIVIGGVIPGSFVAGTYLASRLNDVNLFKMLTGAMVTQGDRLGRIQHA